MTNSPPPVTDLLDQLLTRFEQASWRAREADRTNYRELEAAALEIRHQILALIGHPAPNAADEEKPNY